MTLVLSVQDVHNAKHSYETGAHRNEHHRGGVAQRRGGRRSLRSGLKEDHPRTKVALVQEVARGLQPPLGVEELAHHDAGLVQSGGDHSIVELGDQVRQQGAPLGLDVFTLRTGVLRQRLDHLGGGPLGSSDLLQDGLLKGRGVLYELRVDAGDHGTHVDHGVAVEAASVVAHGQEVPVGHGGIVTLSEAASVCSRRKTTNKHRKGLGAVHLKQKKDNCE